MISNTKPLLIIGTQRSGSNLFRLLINQIPAIEAPHPPHILQQFFPVVHYYGSLTVDNNFMGLIEDIVSYIQVNPVPWTNVKLNGQEIFNRCNQRTLVEVFKVIYSIKAEARGATYWCCKSMANVYYIPEIENNGMQPFYIHLIRDGRDVCASFMNAIVGEKHPYLIAKQWVKDQDLATSMTEKYAGNRTVVVKYEEFINDPQKALTPALSMLGLKWDDNFLKYYESDEAKNTAAAGDMWKNVIKPIDKGNMRHYSEKLTPGEIKIFEKVAAKTLLRLGYTPDNNIDDLKDDFTEIEVQSFIAESNERKKEARKKYTIDAEGRSAQEAIFSNIKLRLGVKD